MKKAFLTICLCCSFVFLGFSQYSTTTSFYDYPSLPPEKSWDQGKCVTYTYPGYYIVAGEYQFNSSNQGICLFLYSSGGNKLDSIFYNRAGYKETAKCIIVEQSSVVYVSCATERVSNGAKGMMIIRLIVDGTKFLKEITTKDFESLGYFEPVDMISDLIYPFLGDYVKILCYKKNGKNDNKIALIRLDTSLSITRSYEYNYTVSGNSETFDERPVKLTPIGDSPTYYIISGGVFRKAVLQSTGLLIYLNDKLQPFWVSTSALTYGKNIYSDTYSEFDATTDIYACGTKSTTATQSFMNISQFSKVNGSIIKSVNMGDVNYASEALKFTNKTSGKMVIAGFSKSQTNNEFRLVTGEFQSGLPTNGIYRNTIQLPFDSKLQDAMGLYSGSRTLFTGQKKSGNSSHMYLYMMDDLGNLLYKDSIISPNACGLALGNAGNDKFVVTGYKGNGSVYASLDYSLFTRIYNYTGLTKTNILKTNSPVINTLQQNTPNPFSQNTIIKYSIPQEIKNAVIKITNINGVLIKSVSITQKDNRQIGFNTNSLPAGIYQYSLYLDGKLAGSKKMEIIK